MNGEGINARYSTLGIGKELTYINNVIIKKGYLAN